MQNPCFACQIKIARPLVLHYIAQPLGLHSNNFVNLVWPFGLHNNLAWPLRLHYKSQCESFRPWSVSKMLIIS